MEIGIQLGLDQTMRECTLQRFVAWHAWFVPLEPKWNGHRTYIGVGPTMTILTVHIGLEVTTLIKLV
jgi:hypothetical protein